MPIGNLVNTKLKNTLARKMGTMSTAASPILNSQINPIASQLDNGIASAVGMVPGLGKLLGTYSFDNKKAGETAPTASKSGMVSDDGTALSESYKMTIESSTLKHTVHAIIQNKVGFFVNGEWAPFMPTTGLSNEINQITQLMFKRVLIARFTSRRIWSGTSPVELTLGLAFNALTDARLNVVTPVLKLLQMASPSETSQGTGIKTLIPPGPSPFYTDADVEAIKKGTTEYLGEASGKLTESVIEHIKDGDEITVSIGKYLKFEKVVVKNVSPVFDTKHDANGFPIAANVQITFQTYEIPTKQSLENMILANGGIK
jgi:hypothetical protein